MSLIEVLLAAIAAFEKALQQKNTDTNTLAGLQANVDTAQMKVDAAAQAKADADAAVKAEMDVIAADTAAYNDALQAVIDAAVAAKIT